MNALPLLETSTPSYQKWTYSGDRKSVRAYSNSTPPSIINQLDIIDIYRLSHPTIAQYTTFPNSHGIFTEIDHIPGRKTYLNKFKKINIIQCLHLDLLWLKRRLRAPGLIHMFRTLKLFISLGSSIFLLAGLYVLILQDFFLQEVSPNIPTWKLKVASKQKW